LKTAVRSPQTVRPYEADSTLQPPNTVPSSARGAPTLNPENGADAFRAPPGDHEPGLFFGERGRAAIVYLFPRRAAR
jgi:hypothetical protein